MGSYNLSFVKFPYKRSAMPSIKNDSTNINAEILQISRPIFSVVQFIETSNVFLQRMLKVH